MAINIIIGLVALSVIIIVHELGHYITAKAAGVKVEEFGLGYPPRIVSLTRGETRYSVNWIPFGGFTKLAGEEDPEVSRSLAGKNSMVRIIVLSAGSLMNVLLAFLLFSITFMIPHDQLIGRVMVEEVSPNSPAAIAGIEPGDFILSVNDKTINNSIDIYRYFEMNLGKEITILIQHQDESTETVRLVPRWNPPQGDGAVGILPQMVDATVITQSYPFWKAIPMGIVNFAETIVLYKNGMISVVIGSAPVDFIGPVGIVQATGEIATRAGASPLLEFVAVISLIIGIINVFPLPALDGGRIAFVLLEVVRRGKRVSPRVEGIVHLVGFALLIAFALAITFQDIMRIVQGESILP